MIATRIKSLRHVAGLGEAVWLFATLRVTLTLVGLLVVTTIAVPQPCHFEEARNGWETMPLQEKATPFFQLVGIWERWDACWYSKIASFGYEPGTDSAAFFPLFPAFIRAVGVLTGGHIPLAGLVVAGLSYVAAMVGLYQLVLLDFPRALARRAMLYLSVFPGALFLFAPFSEAAYLAAAVWTILAARRGNWFFAMAFGFGGGLARPVGALLALPVGWEALRAMRRDRRLSWRFIPTLLAPAAPVLAFVLFDRYAAGATGHSAVDAQTSWAGPGPYQPPWTLAASAIQWIAERADGQEALNLGLLLLCDALVLATVGRMPASYSLYALPHLAVLNTRILPIPLTSTARLLVVIFPVFVAAALLVRRRRGFLTWLIVSLVLLGFVAVRFVKGDFVA